MRLVLNESVDDVECVRHLVMGANTAFVVKSEQAIPHLSDVGAKCVVIALFDEQLQCTDDAGKPLPRRTDSSSPLLRAKSHTNRSGLLM